MSHATSWKERLDDVWRKARTHAFLIELVESRLPKENFLFYIHQDAWFLAEDAKVMAIAASRAPTLAIAARISELITAVNNAEQNRHRVFAENLGRPLNTAELRPAPTAYAYVSHLRSVALEGHFPTIMAALLPCPWLYCDFGQYFADKTPADPVYREWLEPYKDPGFAERVAYHRNLVDSLVDASRPDERLRAERAFETSLRYEERFWSMAMNLERWA